MSCIAVRAARTGDKEAAKALLGATQKGLLKQQNLVKAQANRTTDPRQRKDLLAALHDLDRVLNDLPLSVRSAINNPADNPKALNDIRSAHGAVDKCAPPLFSFLFFSFHFIFFRPVAVPWV